MKIKSNLVFNTSLVARHTSQKGGSKVVIGSAQPEYLVIVAGSTLELEDAKWKTFEHAATPLLKAGSLTMLEAPALSAKEQEAADLVELAKAEAAVAKLSATKTKGAK